MADPDKPIAENKRQHQLTRMYIALDQIEKGDNPTVDDLALVSDAVALTHRYVKEPNGEVVGIPENFLDDVLEANQATYQAYQRHLTGSSIRLTGTGLQAVRRVLDVYYKLLKVAPERTVIQLHRATEKANLEAQNKGHAVILKGTKQ